MIKLFLFLFISLDLFAQKNIISNEDYLLDENSYSNEVENNEPLILERQETVIQKKTNLSSSPLKKEKSKKRFWYELIPQVDLFLSVDYLETSDKLNSNAPGKLTSNKTNAAHIASSYTFDRSEFSVRPKLRFEYKKDYFSNPLQRIINPNPESTGIQAQLGVFLFKKKLLIYLEGGLTERLFLNSIGGNFLELKVVELPTYSVGGQFIFAKLKKYYFQIETKFSVFEKQETVAFIINKGYGHYEALRIGRHTPIGEFEGLVFYQQSRQDTMVSRQASQELGMGLAYKFH